MADKRRYPACVVRLWAVQHKGDLVWTTSVANAHTSVVGLFGFLPTAVKGLSLERQQKGGHEQE